MLSTGRSARPLHPLASLHSTYLATRKAEREAAWLRRSSVWPTEDLRSLDKPSSPRSPAVAPLAPAQLRATYLVHRDRLVLADRISDLAEELHKLSPATMSMDALSVTNRAYHEALDTVAKSRRALARPVLSAWHYDPSPGGLEGCTFQAFWGFEDFERVLVCRSVSPAGLISEQIFLAERLPFANDPRARSIYFSRYDEERGKLVYVQEQVRISDFATTDPSAPPNPRRTERFLYSAPLVKPPAVAPGRVLHPDKAHYVYSGHQSVFFFAGPSPTLRFELAAIGDLCHSERERARKRICLPANLPVQCPCCLEDDYFFVIYAYCGHAQCCTNCMTQYFGLDNRKNASGHRCSMCRAPYPAEFPSKVLDLEQARTSHTLDRDGILRRHAKWDVLTTAVQNHYKGTLPSPSLPEVWDYDVADERERIRVHMGLSTIASAHLWELCTAELVELCAGLREEGLWSLVEAYVGFDGADFFRLEYSPYGRTEAGAYLLESVVERWLRLGQRHRHVAASLQTVSGGPIFF